MENGSLGVMMAARTRTVTKAYLRHPLSCSRLRMPRLDSARITVGNSNRIPIRNTMEVKRDMYELREMVFTIASLTEKFTKNTRHTGSTTK